MSDHPFSTDGKSDIPTSAGRKSWFREDIKRPLFPERRRDGEERSDRDYAEALRHFAREWVEYYIAYYERRAQRCRIGGITIRSIAFTAMVLGGVILVGRM